MRIYAKSADSTGYKEPLAEHTLNDIRAAHRLVENLPFTTAKRKKIQNDLDCIIAFHDVGKAASGFQASLEKDANHWGKRHEIVSAIAASSLGLKDAVIFGIITHHKTIFSDGLQKASSCLNDSQIPYKDNIHDVWLEMAEEWNENKEPLMYEWQQICKGIGREDLLKKPLCVNNTILSENMVSWLSRNDQIKHFPVKEREYFSLLRGLTVSADHIASSGTGLPVYIPKLHNYQIAPPKPYHYQIQAGKKVGNLVLRSPTGSGKTEAALLWAQNNQQRNGRLFYTLPSTASLNAMYLRLGKLLNDIDYELVGLLHSRIASSIYSMLEEDDSWKKQQKAWLLSSLAREMYFPIRVCTPHQIMKFTLFGKGWELMLSEFPHSCFIFDEIHASIPKHLGLIMATAKYIISKSGKCMFLSATLPKFLRKIIRHEIGDISFLQPSPKSDRKILEQERHMIEITNGTILGNIKLIAREAERAKSTLVVCNHVPTAQQVYGELKDLVPDTKLLHSQFARRDRNKIENELQRSKLNTANPSYKPLPKILVSTQVVEVSLDIDFQQGFTEPAPIDALVQRFGRINRYAAQKTPARVRIFSEQFSKDEHVYTQRIRDRSLEALQPLLNKPLSEEAVNQAADQVYGRGYDSDMQDDYNLGFDCIDVKSMIAGTDNDWLDVVIDKMEGTIEVLPEQLVDRFNNCKEKRLAIEAYDLAVPLGRWRLPQVDIDQSGEIYVLRNCIYDSKIGLQL